MSILASELILLYSFNLTLNAFRMTFKSYNSVYSRFLPSSGLLANTPPHNNIPLAELRVYNSLPNLFLKFSISNLSNISLSDVINLSLINLHVSCTHNLHKLNSSGTESLLLRDKHSKIFQTSLLEKI